MHRLCCVFEQAEKNVYLEEKLQVLQQQNEDLKIRIDKNIAVSRSVELIQILVPTSLVKRVKRFFRFSAEFCVCVLLFSFWVFLCQATL